MVLYQFYNTDILDIPSMASEAMLAYVDDALILASAPDFNAMHTSGYPNFTPNRANPAC